MVSVSPSVKNYLSQGNWVQMPKSDGCVTSQRILASITENLWGGRASGMAGSRDKKILSRTPFWCPSEMTPFPGSLTFSLCRQDGCRQLQAFSSSLSGTPVKKLLFFTQRPVIESDCSWFSSYLQLWASLWDVMSSLLFTGSLAYPWSWGWTSAPLETTWMELGRRGEPSRKIRMLFPVKGGERLGRQKQQMSTTAGLSGVFLMSQKTRNRSKTHRTTHKILCWFLESQSSLDLADFVP